MKQSFLICAYNNPDYLSHFISTLDSERSEIYVHIDKNQESNFTDFFAKYKQVDNVHVYSEIPCRYCGIGIVKSIAYLINESLKNKEIGYFHFISGLDLLIKPLNEMLDFFEKNKERSYLEFYSLPASNWGIEGGIEKFRYYYLNDVLTCNDSHKWNNKFNNLLLRVQRKIGVKRKPLPFKQFYGGSAWWSINRAAASELNNFFSLESNWDCIKNTYIPDEFIFQMVLCNSDLKPTLVSNNLRYIKWIKNQKVTHPQTLSIDDYDNLMGTDSFFARKIDPNKSKKLIEKVDRNIGFV